MTNSTPARREASQSRRSKRGEQHGLFIYVIVGAALLAIIAAIVLILIAGSTKTSKSVLDQERQYAFDSNVVVRGLFNISSLEFSESQSASCGLAESYQKPVIMTLRFQTYEVPDSCTIFINDKLLRSERRLDPDCIGGCPFQEFSRQFSLGEVDYRDSHMVKVCCNAICLQKELQGLCNQAAE